MIVMRASIAKVPLFLLLSVVVLSAVLAGCQNPSAASQEPAKPMPIRAADWKTIDRLIDEQKLEEAATAVTALVGKARAARDEATWAKALVRRSQLRTALGGLETAVEELKNEPWPAGAIARSAVELYYAHALLEYHSGYSWEIRQRELVASGETLDLKLWTASQISDEAERAFLSVWERREALGAVDVDDFPYLQANDFPRGVRDTVRDALSYLFVERMLGDSAFWSAAESNEAWQLDLENLLAEAPEATAGTVHPLLRTVVVLADLERWHRQRGELAAELQAYLVRDSLLSSHRQGESDGKQRREALERRLPRFRGDPWWSVGVWSLAQDIDQVAGDPERRIQARKLALEGERAYPGSYGARRCRQLVEQIEAPDFQLQAMSVDGPERRSIEVTHRNLAALHLRAYALDLAAQLARPEFRGFFPNDPREIERLIASGTPAAEWQVELPPTRDFLPHRTFVTPPLAKAGTYVLVASAERGFAEGGNRRMALPFTRSDLVLLEEGQSFPWDVRLVSGRSGSPAEGVEVTLYRNTWRKAPERIMSVRTDATGRAELSQTVAAAEGANHLLLVARRGDDVAFSQRYAGAARSDSTEGTGALLFTDRAIYRPQQKLLWKILGYRSGPATGELKLAPGLPVAVWLTDPNGEKVAEIEVATNKFGTAAGEFEIPAGRLLGQWTLQASLGGQTRVRVEEYKRPTFEVEILEPAAQLRLNRPASLEGSARYYFGLPVTSGRVAWRVARQPEVPWWWRFWSWPGSTEAQQIASGITELDSEGKFSVSFTPVANENEKKSGLTYSYRLESEVTDDGGETRSGERSVRLGWVAVETELVKKGALVVEGEELKLQAIRRDLNGVARPGAGSWRVVALDQPSPTPLPADLPVRPFGATEDPAERFATPGDRLRPRWNQSMESAATLAFFADGREIRNGDVTHDAKGEGAIAVDGLPAGAYRLRYETRDDFGETFRTQLDFYVAGKKTPLALPVEIAFDVAKAEPGDSARLWIHSGLAGAPGEVELLRGEERIWRRPVVLSGSLWFDVPVTEKDRGGFSARLTLISDHQLLTQGARLEVPWTNKELSVEISSFRDKLTPGAKETFRVTVKDARGRPVEARAAELLASMYDKSLDLFAPFSAPRPQALFPNWTYFSFPPLSANLGASGPLWHRDDEWVKRSDVESFRGDAFVEISPYGIGGPGGRFGGRMHRMLATRGGMVAEGAAMSDAAAPAAAPAVPQAAQELRADFKQSAIDQESGEASQKKPPVELRSNFAETAFWRPQLLTGADGSATIEFTVPDSVTSWRVWVAALTQTLASGYAERTVESVKELMIRPYLPRFLREGDRAELKVVVNNAGETPLAGEATLEILDPESNRSLAAEFGLSAVEARKSFRVEPGKGVDLTFPIQAPKRVGATAFKVVATSGALSDGELRPLPLLPSRIHLAQSRFVALKNAERREMTFDDMKKDDPTRIHEQLVVTVDGQLFYSMLDALPYLIDYPYECTEQTMNRFVSTGMLSSLFASYPAVGKMAAELARRETRLERFDQEGAADPNRRMALEETPWLRQARGSDSGGAGGLELLRVLDPEIAKAQRDDALAKLAKAQLPSGGFPWFSGGPPSPYITLYLLSGFARATEFGVDVPKETVVRGWGYLAEEARRDWLPRALKDDCCWELLTFLNYVASSYPDPSWTGDFLSSADRRQILDFSFKHWRDHQPLLKLQLALTLKRMNRERDAQLVLASVMDSAKTTRDEGTFWQPEDRAWLWYNDSIETHAWALRALMEIAPNDPRRDGLVQWLFLNKKLNHWKSTRATAEVLYSLAWYLKATNQLAVREEAKVTVANQSTTFVFEPDRFTGKKNQLVVSGEKLDAVRRPTDATVVVEKETRGLLFASATWHFSTEELPAEARGDLFGVTRRYFKRVKTGAEVALVPIAGGTKLAVGDEVEVQLSLRAKAQAEYVHLRDPRPAGLEPDRPDSSWKWDLGLARYEESRDSGTNFFIEWLPAGEYTLKYRLRANLAGEFRSAPAQVQSIYAPEFVAYSAGEKLSIAPR